MHQRWALPLDLPFWWLFVSPNSKSDSSSPSSLFDPYQKSLEVIVIQTVKAGNGCENEGKIHFGYGLVLVLVAKYGYRTGTENVRYDTGTENVRYGTEICQIWVPYRYLNVRYGTEICQIWLTTSNCTAEALKDGVDAFTNAV
ncbi:hypothetical protein Hdeb2414_s0004g00138171 [Helianthus debilis subsp. tardiflorus]